MAQRLLPPIVELAFAVAVMAGRISRGSDRPGQGLPAQAPAQAIAAVTVTVFQRYRDLAAGARPVDFSKFSIQNVNKTQDRDSLSHSDSGPGSRRDSVPSSAQRTGLMTLTERLIRAFFISEER